MAELDRFEDFRSGVAPPSDDARRRAAARLQGAIEAKHREEPGIMLLVRRRPGRIVLGLAALATAVGTALFVSAPGKNSPGFLERAQAALTPPTGTVLHVKYRWGRPRGTRRDQCAHGSEFWIDQTPPYRYRVLRPFPVPAFCSTTLTTAEIGGTFQPRRALKFVPPNTLRAVARGGLPFRDPLQRLRDALRAGTAVDDGQTQLDGRTVQRIRIQRIRMTDESWYVDPQTFYPIEIHQCQPPGDLPPDRCRSVISILAYEYLPPTTANLALANIRAQHPNATISG